MRLCKRTLEELRNIINGDGTADYRKGYQLVDFFNDFGFHDVYGQGFPSRWVYTDDRLAKINGTPELDKCIRKTFEVVNYIGRIQQLDEIIRQFNQYLAFDKWQVVRNNDEITFKRLDRVIVEETHPQVDIKAEDFLKLVYNVNVDSLGLDESVSNVLKTRLQEVEVCMQNDAPLAAIFLIGSIFEGILLGVATNFPRQFNQTSCAPKEKDSERVRRFPDWTLNNFIDAAAEIGLIKHDVTRFSHVVRDFRNYIHPYSQIATRFEPDKQTAMICFQVLKAAIVQISDYRKIFQEEA